MITPECLEGYECRLFFVVLFVSLFHRVFSVFVPTLRPQKIHVNSPIMHANYKNVEFTVVRLNVCGGDEDISCYSGGDNEYI